MFKTRPKSAVVVAMSMVLSGTVLQGQEIVPTSAALPSTADQSASEVQRVRSILRSLGATPSAPAQLVQLTRELEPTLAAEAYLQVARDFLATGDVEVAARVLSNLVEQHPTQGQADTGALLLVRLYASGELAHAHRRDGADDNAVLLPPGWKKTKTGRTTTDPANHAQLTYALHLAATQLQRNPRLAKRGDYAFQCSVAARLTGRSSQHKSFLTTVKHKHESPAWRDRGRAESWLDEGRKQEPPIPVSDCLSTSSVPHLDGILNESIWESATPVSAAIDGSAAKSEVMTAYDQKHFYLAGRCERIAEINYEHDTRTRTYDADLTRQDRLQISLDVDRDYASCYLLTVDHRGWTNDSCWLDKSWNPKWFVASAGKRFWTFEAAIPWSELVARAPSQGELWAISAVRLTPRQSDAQAIADSTSPFQLLNFK